MSETGIPAVSAADAPQALERLVGQFLAMPVDFSDLPVSPETTTTERAERVEAIAARAATGDLVGAWEEAMFLPGGFEEDYLRGKLLLSRGMIGDATRYLTRAVTGFASYGEAWFLLGVCRYRLGLFTDASQCFLTAIRMNPKHQDAIALWNLAQVVFHRIDPSLNPEAQSVSPLVTDGIVGLDIGCGPRKSDPRLIGIDLIAPGALGEKASVKGQVSAADLQASGDDLHMYQEGAVDLIIARHNLEHYLDPIKTLQEWRRVLRPGGIMALVLPDDEQFDTIHADETHLHTFTLDSLAAMVTLVGGFVPVWSGVSSPLWSFTSVWQKEGGEPYDYLAAVERYRGVTFSTYSPELFSAGQGERRVALVGGTDEDVGALAAQGVTVVPLPTPDGFSGRWMFETLLREERIAGVVTIGVDPVVSRMASQGRIPLVAVSDIPSDNPAVYARKNRYDTTRLVTSHADLGRWMERGGVQDVVIVPPSVDPFFFETFTPDGTPFPVGVVATFDPAKGASHLADILAPVVERPGVEPDSFFALVRSLGALEEGVGGSEGIMARFALLLRDAHLAAPVVASAASADRAARRGFAFLQGVEGVDIDLFTLPAMEERRTVYRLAMVTLVPPGDDARIDPIAVEIMAAGGVAALPDIPLYRNLASDDEALFYPPTDPVAAGALIAELVADRRRRDRMAATARKGAQHRWAVAARWELVVRLLKGEGA